MIQFITTIGGWEKLVRQLVDLDCGVVQAACTVLLQVLVGKACKAASRF